MYLTTFGVCFFGATLVFFLISGIRAWIYARHLKPLKKNKEGKLWLLVEEDSMHRQRFAGVFPTYESARETFLTILKEAYPDGFEKSWIDGDTFDADGDYYLTIEETKFVA